MKIFSVLIFLFALCSCSSGNKLSNRAPSSEAGTGPCSSGIQLFFEESTKRELGRFSEEALLDMGAIRAFDLENIRRDVVFKDLIYAEDEHLREETVKIIALIRKHKPELSPSKVSDFYHELFVSCKL